MSLLEIIDLHSGYDVIRVLQGISFSIKEGQVVSLIGANGAGKSTTLNTISGLIKARSGQILFEGKNITGMDPSKIAKLHLIQVPEGRQVIANMSVVENLLIGTFIREDHHEVQQDLERIFDQFPRMRERRDQKAGLLSGGEQQMLAVGRALMMRPRLLMLDEPSMGLAPLLVNEVFDLIEAIKQQGIPILLVEQNARKALQIADYVYVLDRGMIVREGESEALRKDESILSAYLG
ncbi:ABC transporter ATP-binding protein [Anaerolineales bacterium]